MAKARLNDTPHDLLALKLACEELGLVFCEGQTEHQWFSRWLNDYNAEDAAFNRGHMPENYGKCVHAIRLPWSMHEEETYVKDPSQRPYEIGVVRLPNGSLGLAFDAWSAGKGVAAVLAKTGGVEMSKLMSAVSKHKVLLQVQKQRGHTVKSIERLDNGKTRIVIGVAKQRGI